MPPIIGPPFPTPLTPKTIDLAVQAATIAMLGISPTDAARYGKARVGWQTTGQPGWLITDDVVFNREAEVDDDYNRVRDFHYQNKDAAALVEVTLYTRVWAVFWTLYGPNSFDRARMIRSALFTQAGHDLFAGVNLFLVTDVGAPVRAPELFGSQWWERVDLEAQFNEQVAEAPLVGTAASVEIILENEQGVQRDFELP